MTQTSRFLRRPRILTIRARLTLSFAGLVIGCGAVLIALVYLYMRFVPRYYIELAPPSMPSVPLDGALQQGTTVETTAIFSVQDILDNLLIASFIALVVLTFLGGILGWLLAGRIIAPLTRINDAANRAAAGALDHRVGIDGPRDEIRDLSDTFDRMLSSLERSFAAHRRFAANASHELRTPLATTKTMIDVTLSDRDASADELRALAERIREVNDTNIETVDALLDLAGAEETAVNRESVDLVDLVRGVAADLRPRSESADVAIVVDDPHDDIVVAGNAVLLQRAIDNLVRNGLRYNHAGGRVTLRPARTEGDAASVTVINTGALLEHDAVERLAEPFARGAGRLRTPESGHGLGLAIVSAVAVAHGGSLTLSANPEGGLTAVLVLPENAYRSDLAAKTGERLRNPS